VAGRVRPCQSSTSFRLPHNSLRCGHSPGTAKSMVQAIDVIRDSRIEHEP
jgi:hypothetical protein